MARRQLVPPAARLGPSESPRRAPWRDGMTSEPDDGQIGGGGAGGGGEAGGHAPHARGDASGPGRSAGRVRRSFCVRHTMNHTMARKSWNGLIHIMARESRNGLIYTMARESWSGLIHTMARESWNSWKGLVRARRVRGRPPQPSRTRRPRPYRNVGAAARGPETVRGGGGVRAEAPAGAARPAGRCQLTARHAKAAREQGCPPPGPSSPPGMEPGPRRRPDSDAGRAPQPPRPGAGRVTAKSLTRVTRIAQPHPQTQRRTRSLPRPPPPTVMVG